MLLMIFLIISKIANFIFAITYTFQIVFWFKTVTLKLANALHITTTITIPLYSTLKTLKWNNDIQTKTSLSFFSFTYSTQFST